MPFEGPDLERTFPSDEAPGTPATQALDALSDLAAHSFATSSDAAEAILRAITAQLGMRTSWVSRIDRRTDESLVLAARNEPGGCGVDAGITLPLPDTF